MITIKSRTSGQPLEAAILKESKIRKFFMMRCVKVAYMGSNLKGNCLRVGWFYRNEITITS